MQLNRSNCGHVVDETEFISTGERQKRMNLVIHCPPMQTYDAMEGYGSGFEGDVQCLLIVRPTKSLLQA